MEIIKKNLAPIFAALITLGLLAFAFVSCTGPTAQIVEVKTEAQPPQAVQGGPSGQQQITTYKVTVTVQNKRSGQGQARLTIKLIDKQSGITVAAQNDNVQLSDNETQQLDYNFDLPQGDYETKTELVYPPD